MAQIQQAENSRPRRGVRRAKKMNTRIDMTPMVDLGFLLICFFVITTTMAEPRVADMIVPKEGPPTNYKESKTLTVLLGGDDKVFYYNGEWENALSNKSILSTGYSFSDGIGNIIREKQKQLKTLPAGKENEMFLIIKASEKSDYGNLIDMLDEVLINDLKHYVVTDLSTEEKDYLETH